MYKKSAIDETRKDDEFFKASEPDDNDAEGIVN